MDDLENIKQKISIVDLIQEYTPLKKTGVNFKANCPFHQEKTASFVVSPERNIWHCFGCFPPGQKIKTPFGYHNIEDIDENHYVISGQGLIRKVLATHTRNYKGEMVHVEVRKLGGIVSLTSGHNLKVIRPKTRYFRKTKQFYRRVRNYLQRSENNSDKARQAILKYGDLIEIPAGQLQTSDFVLYPINRKINDIQEINLEDYLIRRYTHGPKPKKINFTVPVNDQLLKLIGYYIAEGSNHRAYIRFSLGNDEEVFANEIVALIKEIFGIEAKIHKRQGIKTGLEVTACNAYLANIFENLCGKGAANKHIPFALQEVSPIKQMVLVRAIHKGDGSSFIANKSDKVHYYISVISRILVEQIIDILLRNDTFPSSYMNKAQVKNNVDHKESYRILWSIEARSHYSLVFKDETDSLFWLLPIKQIAKDFYSGAVHNLTVDQDHSYVATNFAVSNCGKGGDIFKFMMEKEGLSFPEAVETLARKAGITLTRQSNKASDKKSRLFEVNLKAAEFFHYILTKHKLGSKALEYLKKRGVTEQTINEFNLGYAPNSWQSLTDFLKKRGFNFNEITEVGLSIPSKKSSYDRFRGRVIFPLVDTQNNVVGFAGRILLTGEPKYINTPQTPLFNKSNFLFGLNLTKAEVRQERAAILVEGEMDMIMSYQSGVKNITSSKGTALTLGQIELIKRYTDTILLCFDKDLAGDSASRRGIEMADQAGLNIKVIKIPEGKDPAELVLKDKNLWEKAVKEAQNIYDYYLESAGQRYDSKTAEGKKQIAAEILPILAKISNQVSKEHYIQKLSALIATPEDILRKELNKIASGREFSYKTIISQTAQDLPVNRSRRDRLEEYLLSLLLKIPQDLTFVPQFPETVFLAENYRSIYVLLVLYLDSISFKAKSFHISDFVKTLPADLLAEVDRLYLMEIDEKLQLGDVWQKEVDLVVSELKKSLIKASLAKLSEDIKNAQSFGKMDQLITLNKRFRDLSLKLKNL